LPHRLGVLSAHRGEQAEPHVEGAEHFGLGDLADACDLVEEGRARPGRAIEARDDSVGQHAREVARQAAARDVRQSVHVASGEHGGGRASVDACGLQQGSAQGTVQRLELGVEVVAGSL